GLRTALGGPCPMRLMFVYFIAEDAGSAQDIHHYTRAAQELGHEVVLYGWPGALPSFRFRRDLRWAEAVIFVFEWTTNLRFGDQLDLLRIVSQCRGSGASSSTATALITTGSWPA